MSDLLKVTTPLINKNQSVPPSQGAQSLTPFDIQDISKVIKPHNQSDVNSQNNGMIDNKEAPTMLMNLLKDPAIATTYLKNIFLLEEIFKLLPANNKTVTKEIKQMFQALVIEEDEIKGELIKQEKGATMFKGAFFDFLRTLSETSKNTPEVQYQIATLLKSLNNIISKDNILDAVSNGLEYLKETLIASEELTKDIDNLLELFKQKEPIKNFVQLKEKIVRVLEKVEDSILFTSKHKKVLSIITYNLSRYNDNMDYFNESSYRLRQMLTTEQKTEYVKLLEELINQLDKQAKEKLVDRRNYQEQNQFRTLAEQVRQEEQNQSKSKVMDSLTKLITMQAESKNVSQTDAGKIDKMIYSLLSSPCNFTPLLHFILPVIHENMRAFAEVWINPQSDGKDMPKGVEEGKHFLIVIDLDTIGRFEAEFYVYDNKIDFHLFCPPGYTENFENMMKSLPKKLNGMAYQIGNTKLYTLERPRSLMDVFKSLPYKRVGVDVKI